MKKALAVLAVVLLFSTAAFASPAEMIGLGGLNARFTTFSENALANPALLGSYVDRAEISALMGATTQLSGLAIIGVGPGILGIGAGPRVVSSAEVMTTLPKIISNVTVPNPGIIPSNTVNIGYALDLKGLKAGLSFTYGVANTSNKEIFAGSVDLVNKDEIYTSNTFLKLIAGASLSQTLDVAISLALPNYELVGKNFSPTQAGKLLSNPQIRWDGMDVAIDARAELMGLLWALNATYYTLLYQNIDWVDGNLDGQTNNAGAGDVNDVIQQDNNAIGINVLLAKKAKPTENLAITVSSGVKVLLDGSGNGFTEDKVAGVKTIVAAQADSGLNITIPLNLAVEVALGKLVTWENGKHSLEMGISKNIAVLDNYASKTINPANSNTVSKIDNSDLNNAAAVTGGAAWKWEIGDFKGIVGGGVSLIGYAVNPNFCASAVYAWK